MKPETQSGQDFDCYLSDLSPKEKPWDVHKGQAEQVRDGYWGTDYYRYAERIDTCSGFISYSWVINHETGERRLKLRAARFCRCRNCPVCQWRKSKMWVARFLNALPAIQVAYPRSRFIFLTLTVTNCPVDELRLELTAMNKAWQRLTQRQDWPAIGFARSVEVTRGKDGSAHPHFHALLMVKDSYFKRGYLSQAKWTELWQSCLGVDYTPVVHVQAIKPNPKHSTVNADSALQQAILETFKYAVKPDDLVADRQWLLSITKQLHKTRSVTLGGVLKELLKEGEPEDWTDTLEENEELEDEIALLFGWREQIKRYVKVNP